MEERAGGSQGAGRAVTDTSPQYTLFRLYKYLHLDPPTLSCGTSRSKGR